MTNEFFHFCVVQPEKVSRQYTYLIGDHDLSVGDWVEVPFGKYNHPKKAQIVKIIDCVREEAPWPPEKTKTVVGKTTEPELPPVYVNITVEEDTAPIHAPEVVSRRHDEPTPVQSNGKRKALIVPAIIAAIAVGLMILFSSWNRKYDMAIESLENGDYPIAEAYAETLPNHYRNTSAVEELAQAGNACSSDKTEELRDAIDLAKKYVKKDHPLSDTAKEILALLNTQLNKTLYSEALEDLRQGISDDGLIDKLTELGNYEDAHYLLCYAKALLYSNATQASTLKLALNAISEITVDGSGQFDEEVLALQNELPEKYASAKQKEDEEIAERKRAEEQRIAALEASGIPYVGMSEGKVNSTRQMGQSAYSKHHEDNKRNMADNTYYKDIWNNYNWYTSDGHPLMTVVCRGGVVTEVTKYGGTAYWNGDVLLVKTGPVPQSFNYGKSGNYSIRDDYDSPEDLYEDNPGDYEDEDEAWDEWYDW